MKNTNQVNPMKLYSYEMNEEFDLTHWWFIGRNKIIINVLKRFMNPITNANILDYGSGTGGVSITLSKFFKSLICYEPTENGAVVCRQRGLTVFTKDEELTQITSIPFDAILCLDVLEHIEDEVNFLKSSFKHLKSDGIGLLTVPAYEWLWGSEDISSNHIRRYNQKSLIKVLKKAGFQIQYISGFNSFLLPIQALIIIIERNLHAKATSLGLRSNLKKPNKLEHFFCSLVLALEAFLLKYIRFPFGASLIIVVKKI